MVASPRLQRATQESARPCDQHCAQRVEPDFRCCGRELVAIIGVADAISDDRLARGAHPANCIGEIADRRLSAASEAVEVECDRLHSAIVLRLVESLDEVTQAIFAESAAAREVRPLGARGLLDDAAIQIDGAP